MENQGWKGTIFRSRKSPCWSRAVNAMYRVIMESDEPVTLVPIATLTNLALLFAMYPEVKAKIREIVMMGGSASREQRMSCQSLM